ncbi:MAG: hypothetical protein LBI72_10295 [Flavobacteriaceae bacterium]|jgi:hypothetical protein|nr:hypothetical protein [Flavobacteriaceae bacterium]
MKFTYILAIFTLCSFNAFAQHAVNKIDKNSDWKNYQQFTEKTYDGVIMKNEIQYDLSNGKINAYRIMQNTEIEAEFEVRYDKDINVQQEMKIYDSGRGIVRELVYKSNLLFDEKNNLLDDGQFIYSKFVNGRPQIATTKDFNELKKQGTKKSFSYDENGLIKLEKSRTEGETTRTTVVTTYKYDQCKNVVEISNRISEQNTDTSKKRKNNAVATKPSVEKINYEYEYQGCLWTKKYIIVDGTKKLLAERTFE